MKKILEIVSLLIQKSMLQILGTLNTCALYSLSLKEFVINSYFSLNL